VETAPLLNLPDGFQAEEQDSLLGTKGPEKWNRLPGFSRPSLEVTGVQRVPPWILTIDGRDRLPDN
jgi:hypothetical protein